MWNEDGVAELDARTRGERWWEKLNLHQNRPCWWLLDSRKRKTSDWRVFIPRRSDSDWSGWILFSFFGDCSCCCFGLVVLAKYRIPDEFRRKQHRLTDWWSCNNEQPTLFLLEIVCFASFSRDVEWVRARWKECRREGEGSRLDEGQHITSQTSAGLRKSTTTTLSSNFVIYWMEQVDVECEHQLLWDLLSVKSRLIFLARLCVSVDDFHRFFFWFSVVR